MRKRMDIFFLVILSFFVVDDVDARVIVVPPAQSDRVAQSRLDKDRLVKELDTQLLLSSDNGWNDKTSDLLLDLLKVDRQLAHDYFKKMHEKSASVISKEPKVVEERFIQPEQPLEEKKEVLQGVEKIFMQPTPLKHKQVMLIDSISKNEIMKKLDEQLSNSDFVSDEWKTVVNDLLFDLSMVDRDKASEYLKKMYATAGCDVSKIAPIVRDVQEPAPIIPSSSGTGIKKGVPPAAPKKKDVPSAVPSSSMKKGTPPAAPKPGQGKVSGAKKNCG